MVVILSKQGIKLRLFNNGDMLSTAISLFFKSAAVNTEETICHWSFQIIEWSGGKSEMLSFAFSLPLEKPKTYILQ